MKSVTLKIFCICLILFCILSACSSPASTVSPSDVTATLSAEEPAETTPSALPSATQTASPAPTLTPTPLPPLPCNIVFDTDRDRNNEVYSMKPDGSDQINLTQNPGDDFDPVWSPDGARIAFISNRENETGNGQFVYMMLADGSDVQQISHQTDSQFPDWSPAGSHIAYSSGGDIFLIDLLANTEVNLSNTPEMDKEPKFSPDGQHIAWLSGSEGNFQVFLMDLDGSHVQQVTEGGTVHGLEWTVDGRIYAHWDHPDGICFNCVVSANGEEVMDAGGKGEIQKYLPFWTIDDQRVEMAQITGPNGDEEIFLVSEIFPDLFFNLSNNPANDWNPDIAAQCGPSTDAIAETEPAPTESQPPQQSADFVIGYAVSENDMTPFMQEDLERACNDLSVQCVRGDDIASLTSQKVDAIISFSNRWHVMGSYPQLHDAVVQGIPVFMLNAETTEQGAYNLSVENETTLATLNWIFKKMGDTGKFVYYNFGDSSYHQELIDAMLEDYPDIDPIKKEVSYNGPSFTQDDITNMIAGDPNLGGIWADENQPELFWGAIKTQSDHIPFINCLPKLDLLNAWKENMDAGSPFECVAYIKPGGVGYEAVYAAYYYLSGHQFKPEALVGTGGNTLKYNIAEITKENLSEWLSKVDTLRIGQGDVLEFPPMGPEEILSTWFIE